MKTMEEWAWCVFRVDFQAVAELAVVASTIESDWVLHGA